MDPEDQWIDDPALNEAIQVSLRDTSNEKSNNSPSQSATSSQSAMPSHSNSLSSPLNQSKPANNFDDVAWDESDEINEALTIASSSSQDPEFDMVDDPEFTAALIESLREMDEKKSSPDKRSTDLENPKDIALSITRFGCVVDARLETIDPIPDIFDLFGLFDQRFFGGRLTSNAVSLSWSPRMTTCAGLCRWSPRNRLCEIRLSKPLLSLRPRKDLVETLLHEMIHALLFVCNIDDNHESHGDIFHHNMFRINKEGGCKITVYHSFHDEVRFYKRHVWRCNGPCVNHSPFYGIVRRATNRAPGPNDFWYERHKQSCGGTYIKISDSGNTAGDPNFDPNAPAKTTKKAKDGKGKPKLPDIRQFFTPSPKKEDESSTSSAVVKNESKPSEAPSLPPSFVPFTGVGHVLGSSSGQPGISRLLFDREKKKLPPPPPKPKFSPKPKTPSTCVDKPSQFSSSSSSSPASTITQIPKSTEPHAKKSKIDNSSSLKEREPPVITLD